MPRLAQVDQALVPGEPIEDLAAEREQRRPLAGSQPRQERRRRVDEVGRDHPLGDPDHRRIPARAGSGAARRPGRARSARARRRAGPRPRASRSGGPGAAPRDRRRGPRSPGRRSARPAPTRTTRSGAAIAAAEGQDPPDDRLARSSPGHRSGPPRPRTSRRGPRPAARRRRRAPAARPGARRRRTGAVHRARRTVAGRLRPVGRLDRRIDLDLGPFARRQGRLDVTAVVGAPRVRAQDDHRRQAYPKAVPARPSPCSGCARLTTIVQMPHPRPPNG